VWEKFTEKRDHGIFSEYSYQNQLLQTSQTPAGDLIWELADPLLFAPLCEETNC